MYLFDAEAGARPISREKMSCSQLKVGVGWRKVVGEFRYRLMCAGQALRRVLRWLTHNTVSMAAIVLGFIVWARGMATCAHL